MPLKNLNIAPGLNTLETDRGARARWKNGDKVRFWRGMPQKIGGWQKNGSNTFTGIARSAIDWLTLAVEKFIGFGTHLKLYVWKGGAYYDITPIRSTDTLGTDPFSTTDTETEVGVEHVGHGGLVGDFVTYSGAAAVGGITISGEYQITTVVDADNYTITHGSAATSTATGGGAVVEAVYQIHVGAESTTAGYGWGASTWSASTWGTARSVTNFLNIARIWSLDNWGEDLIACPREGGIYLWDASVGTGTRAAAISGAPSTARAIFVSEENRHLVVLGAHDGSADDPLLVRWSTSEDYTVFTPSDLNTAGEKRLDGGNELYCRVETRGESLIFSDTIFWSMTFEGPPYTFGWKNLGPNGGIRSPNAAIELDGRVFWMGEQDFFVYDGAKRVLPCEVLNHVFDDFNATQSAKVYAGVNRKFGEVWWLYPSANASDCDRYVIYNALEDHWSFGTLARSLYVGDSNIFNNPYAVGQDGYLYDHEYGVNADGGALGSSLESGDIEIGEGEEMIDISGAIPDFKRLEGSVDVTLKGRRYPQDSDQYSGAVETITSATKKISPRMRARQIALLVESDAIDDDWRMGQWRVELRAHGKQ